MYLNSNIFTIIIQTKYVIKLNLKISKANYLHTHVKKEIAQPFIHLA